MMNIKVVGGAVVIGFIVLAALYFTTIIPGQGGLNANMTATWKDKDGKPITLPLAFVNPGGVVVTGVTVRVTATITSTSGKTVESPILAGKLTVTTYMNTPTMGVLVPATDYPISVAGASALAYSKDWDFQMSTLIPTIDNNGKTYGWVIEFKVTLTAAGTVSGDMLKSSPWNGSLCYKITWGTDGLALVGTVTVPGG